MCDKEIYIKGTCKKCGFYPIFPIDKLGNNEVLYKCECGNLRQVKEGDEE